MSFPTQLEDDPEFTALWERAKKLPPMTHAQMEAQRRSWVIGELMLEHKEMSREEAERIYDRVTGPPGCP